MAYTIDLITDLYRDINVFPEAQFRKTRRDEWKTMAKIAHSLNISNHVVVNKADLADKHLKQRFVNDEKLTLKFKPENHSDFSAFIESNPTWHAEMDYITLTMGISKGYLALSESPEDKEEIGTGTLRLKFNGRTSTTSVTRKGE